MLNMTCMILAQVITSQWTATPLSLALLWVVNNS